LAPQPAGHADILQPVRWAKAYDQAGEGSAAIGPTAVVDLMQEARTQRTPWINP